MNENTDENRVSTQFGELIIGKKNQNRYLKLFLAAVVLIIISILFYSYKLISDARNRIVVVSTSGEFLPLQKVEQDELMRALIKSHCFSTAYFVNSFDVTNIKLNQVRASYLVNRSDLNAIFEKYKNDNAYNTAINAGYVYRCDFDKVLNLKRVGEEYEIEFRSILQIINSGSTRIFEVISKGILTRVTPRYPENPTGFFFSKYEQNYYNIKEGD